MPKKDYSQWDKKDLISHIQKLEKRKKYGLVWDVERTREQFELQAQNGLPVLEEVPNNSINTKPEQPMHILIEGDNYHALSVMNYTHEKNVDVIFIDPPYNKGLKGKKDFRYNDRYVDKDDPFRHSKWLSFISKRLVLARSLLKKTGVIFITIDDNEAHRLRCLLDEIFGEDNFIANVIWQKKYTRSNDANYFSDNHDHILVYAKSKDDFTLNLQPRTEKQREAYSNPDNHPKGPWKSTPLHAKSGENSEPYTFKNGIVWSPPPGTFRRFAEETLADYEDGNEIWFGVDGTATPSRKSFLKEVKEGVTPVTVWTYNEVGHSHEANDDLKALGLAGAFDNPKPVRLIKRIINIATETGSNGIVLDFFAGSGTTAQAVIELNNEDGGKRQCILITNNENEICTEVCYPRVSRVIKGTEFEGTEKISLFEEYLTISKLKKIENILADFEQTKEDNLGKFEKIENEFEENTLRLIGIKRVKGWKDGLGGNLKYYRTSFVPSEPSDENKELLTRQSIEMLCLRESTFDFVTETDVWKLYENREHYAVILFDQLSIPELKKELEKLKKPVSVYIFSLEDDNFANEFSDMKDNVKICSIPEAILRVYRRIYQ